MSANDNQGALTISQLMARWSCSRKVLLAMIHGNKLVAFKLGDRAYRVAMTEVLRIEAAREQAA